MSRRHRLRCRQRGAHAGDVHEFTSAEVAAAVEDHLLDAHAARERATDDRVIAEQVEAEAIREVRHWEIVSLELAFEAGSRT